MKQYLINRFVGLEFGNKGIFAQDSCSACHVQIIEGVTRYYD